MFASQVLDDRLETGQPDQMEPSENSKQLPEPNIEEEHNVAPEESSNQEDVLEGSFFFFFFSFFF